MIYLLDTDVMVFLVRGFKPRGRKYRAQAEAINGRSEEAQAAGHTVGLSAISVAELEFGAWLTPNYHSEIKAVRKAFAPFELYPFDVYAAPKQFGVIRHALERQGTPIGAMDLLIAAHALSLGAALVTNNREHFGRVPDLVLADWLSI